MQKAKFICIFTK